MKQERYDRLMKTQMEILSERSARYIGQKLEVIVENYHPDSEFLLQGRFYGQCPDIDGSVIINDGRCVESFGQLYEVEITDVIEYDLIGKATRPLKPPCSLSHSPLQLI